MKKILIIAVIAVAGIIGANIYVKTLYEDYIRTSEELLWELEEMCEQHDIHWGDTVCEGDTWSDYCDARKALGLNYFEHYTNKTK
jgi:hypothetical protein